MLVILTLGIFGIGAFSQGSGYTVLLGYNSGLGTYMIDGHGMTLYYFTKDVAGGSMCTAGCLDKWPVFYTADIVVPPGLDPADFGTITRADGTNQTTYKGWPLYYFVNDKAAGDTNGEGVKDVWYVMRIPFYTVMLANKEGIGPYLVDANGMTLYYFKKDTVGVSNCSGGCLQNWPAFYAEQIIVPSTINMADFGTITRADGTKQTTYKGWPLYYFFKDANRGDTNGQGVKDVWFVIDPFNFTP